jgi:hypothetical protein
MPKAFPSAAYRRSSKSDDDTMLCKTIVTKDRRYITQITCYEKGSSKAEESDNSADDSGALRLKTYGKQTNGGALASLFSFPGGTRSRNRQQQLLSGTWPVTSSYSR